MVSLPEYHFDRATKFKQRREEQKEFLKEELLSHGPKAPAWDVVEFHEEICKRFLKGDVPEYGCKRTLSSPPGLTMLSWNYGVMVRGAKNRTPQTCQA